MTQSPVLSVIVPVYNAEESLEKCLSSIVKQVFTAYEVLLIDDGSKDRSGEICDKFVNIDQRFIVIHTENRGVSAARNTGLENIRGKYVMFIDCDDYIYPDYFDTYVGCIEHGESDVVIGGLVRKEGNDKSIKLVPGTGKWNNELWEIICKTPEMYGYIAGKIIRTDIIKNHSIQLNEDMYSQEDMDFNLSVYEKCKAFEVIEYAGYEYEYVSGKRKPPVWDFIKNALKLYHIAESKIDLSIEAKEAIKNRITNQIFSFLYYCNSLEEYKSAIGKLNTVAGLDEYLQSQSLQGERRLVVNWYLAKKYDRIHKYFLLRKMIKKMMGKPITE